MVLLALVSLSSAVATGDATNVASSHTALNSVGSVIASLTTSSSTKIATHTVQVGPKTSPHAYVPNRITANPGDLVVFEFYPTNHSVAKADYLAPCVPASEGVFWSGIFDFFDEINGELVGPVCQNDKQRSIATGSGPTDLCKNRHQRGQ